MEGNSSMIMKSVMGMFVLYLSVLTVVVCASRFGTTVTVSQDGEESTIGAAAGVGSSAEETEVMAHPEESEGTLSYCLRLLGDGATDAVGVYDVDGVLLRLVDLPLSVLPEGDVARLREGISVENEDALAALIVDFGG